MKIDLKSMGIALKTSVVSSIVVFLLLTTTAVVILSMESNTISYIIDSLAEKEKVSSQKQADEEKKALSQRHSINAKICSGMSASFLYNFEAERLQNTLKPFLNLPDIVAIVVTDSSKKPFAAIWKKDAKITTGKELPVNIKVDHKLSFIKDVNMGEEKVGFLQIFYTDEIVVGRLIKSQKKSEEAVKVFRGEVDNRFSSDMIVKIFAFIFVIFALMLTIVLTLKRLFSVR